MKRNKLVFWLVLLGFSATAMMTKGCSCLNQANKDVLTEESETPTSGHLKVATDDALAPVIQKQIDEFSRIYPKAKFDLVENSTRKVVEMLLNKDVRAVVFSYKLSAKEDSVINALGLHVKKDLVARDALCLIVNAKNPVKSLSMNQLKLILSGEAENWSLFGGKNQPIQVFYTSPNDARNMYLRDTLRISQFAAKAYPCTSAAQMREFVTKYESAIGYESISNLRDLTDPDRAGEQTEIKLLSVSADSVGAKAYLPLQSHVYEGYYPLTYGVYHLYYEFERLPQGFAAFLSREGQKMFLRNGVAPIENPVRIIYFKQDE
ncbi:phosphate-binding protein, putative [Chloroherpeton thalassium ATCC 35110]|uniref:Phosphate-binding protein, putative n=1 Tax=Chloroherpeton thalassium (strain ATCC 35110 / GB-78) TaxID=517418 RepID=B3QVX2_CHLT3|nr:substrate-binding domain-containing protein [Chloroherpeton thalassium]ACF14626.1 phosphate-binding protein, putative [Chloroherpeton thalassium ATCC 35110]